MNYPEGFTSADRDHVHGVVYTLVAPAYECMAWGSDMIYFDYTVLLETRLTDLEIQVEVAGFVGGDSRSGVLDFEYVCTFESVDDAIDWVYSFDSFDLSYEQAKGAITSGR